MSDNRLLFIPVDPGWCPSSEAAARALQALRSMAPNYDEVSAECYGETRFHTAVENWSGVACPSCGSDLGDWFDAAVNTAYEESKFSNLKAVTPCCQARTSLNDVRFGWPAGFSVFALEAMNPGFLPTPDQIAEIEDALGHKCRIVWEHI